MNQPFIGLKVIELASVLAGPSVGQFFAELGADVLKVENATTNGDVTRSWKLKSEDQNSPTSAYFASVNWGKKHIFKNVKLQEDKQEVLNLIAKADIVITSYKPGDAEKLGFDYDSLKKINPTIICGNISGYGKSDSRAGYDAVIQAEVGYMYMNGEKNTPPTKMPLAIIDILTAHQLKEGILTALYLKEKTGKGRLVEANLFDSGVAALTNQGTNYLVANHIPQQMGSDHPNIVPYGTVYYCKNEQGLVLAVGSDKQFKSLCNILNISDLSDNERFKTNFDRVQNRVELNDILKNEILKLERKQFLELLNKSKVPAGAVNNIKELFDLDSAQKMILDFGYDNLKGIKSVAFKLSE